MSNEVKEGKAVRFSGFPAPPFVDSGWVEAREIQNDHIEIVLRRPSNNNQVSQSLILEGTREEAMVFASQLMNLARRSRP